MVVVEPESPAGARESGMVVAGMISNTVPDMVVSSKLGPGVVIWGIPTWREVEEGTMRYGVPFIIVVEPWTHAGARDAGIVVGGTTTNGVPEMSVVVNGDVNVGEGVMVVGWIIRKGVLFIVVVDPEAPGGAWDRGMVVKAAIVMGACV